ncbi:Crp/Fnr family transcriptional regulator [Argonema antarcticum]|uniref:Crp/Fnr family transcriptional regulator n=1 Tax=Argonema antarcticum TaxID=2942763 RepID=UPI002012DB81|nr:Crp/Fnr family transcriptional regulator [Argonema antarcticum]MCL1475830.1 Crp/Fnr family transcriptional regulator [Argonema antarcticum A004/B2]
MPLSAPIPLNLTNLKQRTFSCHDLLPLQSDSLWKIERGVVRTLTCSEEGRSIVLGFWGPGDVVGKPLSRLDPYQIECLTSAEVSLLPSHLWYQVMDAWILHAQESEELLSIVHNRPVNLRLLQLLNWLARKFGREVEGGKLIELPLTHQALSEVICTTRVTVTRLLNQFEQEGILNRRGRFLILGRQK